MEQGLAVFQLMPITRIPINAHHINYQILARVYTSCYSARTGCAACIPTNAHHTNYQIDPDDISQEREKFDLDSYKVDIEFLVEVG